MTDFTKLAQIYHAGFMEEKISRFFQSAGDVSVYLWTLMAKQDNCDIAHMKRGIQYHFMSKKKPTLNIHEYYDRITSSFEVEGSTLLIACYYLRKLQLRGFFYTELNLHRFLFIAILLATKFNEDRLSKLPIQYARLSGMDCTEILKLEIYFCKMLNYELFCDQNQIANFIFAYENELHSATSV